MVQEAIASVENDGIVFLDEIDKICAREGRYGGDVSREGVQRDLLPLIEGTTVATKYGPVKTDHILFIASGAFHVAKPSDLLPELQGRLPIRVELHPLTKEDFRRILTETEASLIKQYMALMATEGLELEFTDDAIDAIASIAVAINCECREHRRAAAADGDGAGARRGQLHRRRPQPARRWSSTRNTSRTISATSPATPISAASFSDRGRILPFACLNAAVMIPPPVGWHGLTESAAGCSRRSADHVAIRR